MGTTDTDHRGACFWCAHWGNPTDRQPLPRCTHPGVVPRVMHPLDVREDAALCGGSGRWWTRRDDRLGDGAGQ